MPRVRFRGLAAAKSSAAGTLVTFADGKRALLAKRSPLASLPLAAIEALTNGLLRLLDDATDAVISRTGSFSRRLVEYVVANTPALAEVPRDAVGLAEAMTHWLEAVRHDYTVSFSLQIDWVAATLPRLLAPVRIRSVAPVSDAGA